MSSFKGTLGGDEAVVNGGKGKLAVVGNGGNAAKAIGATTGDAVVLSKVANLK